MYERWRSLPEEVRFLGRLALYAIVVGIVYWFVSYEPAGTVLLLGFGIATGAGCLVLWRGARAATTASTAAADGRLSGDPALEPLLPDGPFGDESGPIPVRSLVPLTVGFGIAVIALGLVFGPWLILAGLVPLFAGAWSWLRSAGREIDL